MLCAAPGYLQRRGTPAGPGDLVHHDCLIYSLLRARDEWRFREPGAREAVSVPVEGRFSAASGAVLRQAALAGMGLAVLPTFMIAGDLRAGTLVALASGFQGVELGIYALYPRPPRARRPPVKVRAFVDLLVAAFRAPPWAGAAPRA